MKQLSALGARRHAFFRSPRRMRPLVDRLEPGELIPNGPFSFYGGGYGRPRAASLRAGMRGRAGLPAQPPGLARPLPRRASRGSPRPGHPAVLPVFPRCSPVVLSFVLPLFSRCFPVVLPLFSRCSPAVLPVVLSFVLPVLSRCSPVVLPVFSRCCPGILPVLSRCSPAVLPLFSRCSPGVLLVLCPLCSAGGGSQRCRSPVPRFSWGS